MLENRLLKRLSGGQVCVGCLLAFDAPWFVEVLGWSGYDFVTIDLEHEPIGDQAVSNLIRAAEGVGMTPIARMACTERIIPMLTAGIQGIQIPDVRDAEHAREIVETTRFRPLGRRTYYAQTRSGGYSIGFDAKTWTKSADENLLVIGTIEDIDAVEKLDTILNVDGIDAYHVGPLDLAQSMGSPTAEELEETLSYVVERCRHAGRYVSVGLVTPWGVDTVSSRVDQGAQLMSISSAWTVTDAMSSFLAKIESCIPEASRPRTAARISREPYMPSQ